MALAFAPLGRELRVIKVNAGDKLKRHLENLGFVSGASVMCLVDSNGDLILRIKDCKVAINKALAMKIMVA